MDRLAAKFSDNKISILDAGWIRTTNLPLRTKKL